MKTSRDILTHLSIAVVLLCPISVSAQILINEIAWMGSASNANAEWIELKNTSNTPVSLEGWTLSAEDGSPAINVSGTIAASGFFLLERTSDESAQNVTADLIYSGALGNTGETLTLKNESGQSIDTVSGGENWQNIGGDNATKQTAQRTASTWITAAPTPRAQNLAASEEDSLEEETENTASETSSSSGGGGGSVAAPSFAPVARANAGKDRVVTVGVDTHFEGFAYDAGNKVIDSARFLWNFGDGTIAEGKNVVHRWSYPGRYATVLEVSRFESKASHRITITAEVPELLFRVSDDGSIIIENLSSRDIDLSGWRISSNGAVFVFSPHSVVLRNASIRLSPSALHFNASLNASLLYPDGTVAVEASRPVPPEAIQLIIEEDPPPTPSIIPESVENTVGVLKEIEEQPESVSTIVAAQEPVPEVVENAAAVGVVATEEGVSILWWFGALLTVVLGVAAVFFARHLRSKEWRIIEEGENDV